MREWLVLSILLLAVGARFSAVAEEPIVAVDYDSKERLGKGVTLGRLNNGLVVIVKENHATPVATARCFVRQTGGAFEGKYLGAGISHLAEHLVAGGSTTTRSEDEIQEIMDSLGGATNAYTSDDITAYHVDCPASRIATAIELVADSMQNAKIAQDEFNREMGVVTRELEMGESQRARVQHHQMKRLIFQIHPMRTPTIGYLPVLTKLTRDDVYSFVKDRYVPQNMVFTVVGAVKTDEVMELVKKNFANFRRTAERQVIMPVEPEQASPRAAVVQMEGPTVNYAVAWPTVPLQDPDLYPLDVASALLSHGDSSRLVRRLKIDQPLVISVSSSSYTPGWVKGWFQISATVKPENLDKIRPIILEEIAKLASNPPSEAELAKVKRQTAAQHVFGQQTVESQAETLASSFISTGDPLFDDYYVEGIQKVTPEQIQRVIRKYFLPERQNTVVIEPIGGNIGVLAEAGSTGSDSAVVEKELANGLTVLIRPNRNLPLVTVQAYVKAGLIADTNATSGLSSLATAVMERGTEKYSGRQIAEFFDNIGGSIRVDSQRNSSFIQATMLKGDFAASLDYVYQVLFKPTFPNDEFAKLKERRLGMIANRAADPVSEIMDFWTLSLPKDSPNCRTVLGTTDTISKLTAEDARKFHASYFVPNNMVLAIYGDIDVDQTLMTLSQTFGRIPRSNGFTWPSFPETAKPLDAPIAKHLTNKKPGTGMVLVAYPTISIFDQQARSAMEMLEAILTDGLGSRLYGGLRQEQLVYYVHGVQIIGFAPGYFVFLAQTQPESVPTVVDRIQASLKKIRDEGIPADEFAKAKDKLLAAHAMKGQTVSEQAFQAGVDELYGLGYDYDKTYPERLKKVTEQDVVNLVSTLR